MTLKFREYLLALNIFNDPTDIRKTPGGNFETTPRSNLRGKSLSKQDPFNKLTKSTTPGYPGQ